MAISPVLRLRPEGLEWREIEGEIVVVDLVDEAYLTINGSGTALWPLLLDGTTAAALADVLERTYGLPRAQAEGDVDAFVAQLTDAAFLATASAAPGPPAS